MVYVCHGRMAVSGKGSERATRRLVERTPRHRLNVEWEVNGGISTNEREACQRCRTAADFSSPDIQTARRHKITFSNSFHFDEATGRLCSPYFRIVNTEHVQQERMMDENPCLFFLFCFVFLLWPMGSPLLNVGVRYFLCLFLLFDWQFSTIEKRRHDVTTIQRKLQSRFFVTWMSVIVSLCFCTFLLVVVDSLLPAVPDGLLRPDCPQINTRSYSTFLDFSNKFLFSLLAIEDHRHPIRCCWNSDKTNSKGRKKVTIAVEYGSQFGRDWWRWKIHLIAVSLQYLLQSNPNSVTDDFDHQLDCKDGQWINRWRMEVTRNIPFMAPVMAMDR